MISQTSDSFISNREWHQAVVGGKDVILRRTSALEYHQLFGGYMREKNIDVYAKRRGEYENVNYHIVNTFDGIDYIQFRGVLCASVNQTINDMLADFDHIDEQSLLEGLSRYYHTHGKSFDGLMIMPENIGRFDEVKDWAIEYHSGG